MIIESYEDVVLKEIVRVIKASGLKITDNSNAPTPLVYIAESREIDGGVKTFQRNEINYIIKMWGSKNGARIEVINMKQQVLKALKQLNVEGYVLSVYLNNVATFKEVEDKATHYYQSIVEINIKISEEAI